MSDYAVFERGYIMHENLTKPEAELLAMQHNLKIADDKANHWHIRVPTRRDYRFNEGEYE